MTNQEKLIKAGLELRKYRLRHDVTQKQVADEMPSGNFTYVCQLEKGKKGMTEKKKEEVREAIRAAAKRKAENPIKRVDCEDAD